MIHKFSTNYGMAGPQTYVLRPILLNNKVRAAALAQQQIISETDIFSLKPRLQNNFTYGTDTRPTYVRGS
jgi:hypothetical protein